jgi:hypothetical protein
VWNKIYPLLILISPAVVAIIILFAITQYASDWCEINIQEGIYNQCED